MSIFNIIVTIIYTFFNIKHNLRLRAYNKLLEGKSSFEVMFFDNGASWNYLLWSILYVLAGLGIIYLIWNTRQYIESVVSGILNVLAIATVIVLIIFSILTINNPILQSALAVIVIVSIGAIATQS